ncbi:MAG: putative DNA-binding domain-containing protein [Proteobacteria bacterium]|nr:putative DNA-binding domain-containing protein [Pseudomonadota bacterium]
MKIADLQNKFIDSIYAVTNPDLLTKIKDGKAPKEELLDIYRNNLRGTLSNALRITYPETHKNLGAKKFQKLCDEFIKKNRSLSGNLDDYGQGFANELEWLQHKSYLAKDVKPLNLKKLQKLTPEKLFEVKFKLHPSCFLHKNFVIFRQDFEVKLEKISRAETNFLLGVKDGLSLYKIYEKYEIDIQHCLQKYLTNGVLCAFTTS